MPEIEHIYSEEANEILGRMPSWLIRRGIGMIFLIFIGVLIGCYFVKYPQTTIAPIVITTINPPADLIVRANGKIDTLFVQDQQNISKNDIVALLYNTADYKSVLVLTDSLQTTFGKKFIEIIDSPWIDREYPLGEIQASYADFRRIWMDYKHYIQSNNIDKRKSLLIAQIIKNQEYYKKQIKQKYILDQDLSYENKNVERDSILLSKNVISTFDYEQSIRSRLQKQNTQANFDAGLTNTELMILQIQQQLAELTILNENEIAEYERLFSQSRQNLIAQIEQWNNLYVIRSPIIGTVSMTKYWSSNQSIQVGERLASIVPKDRMEVIGRMTIPFAGFGNVKIGQNVNVKLDGFPYMEYGMLKGNIISLSDVPEDNGYIAEVAFSKGLQTTYNKNINLIQQMNGVGEIQTKDMRLIERFIQPVRALFDQSL